MRIRASLAILAILARQALANAPSPLFGQCGGLDYTGTTACISGSSCKVHNERYSLCVPEKTNATDITSRAAEAATGFVRASGRQFYLNGKPFYFGGTNAYWTDDLNSEDLNSLFSQMNSAGLRVLRIFAWGDTVGYTSAISSNTLQLWSGSTNTPNPEAFEKIMDPIVNAAVAHNIRLVVCMIGNWGGSINVYLQQILGSKATHDTFYSNSRVVAAYKKYVGYMVNRYKNSPGIFAWELMNEAQCSADDSRGVSSACNSAMITNWVKEMSSYIKSLDGNHMVTMGDCGWFTPADGFGNSPPYAGTNGIDWTTNLKINTIDYGTIHLYPGSWGESNSWGNTWIEQHAQKAEQINKPVVLEEFGTGSNGRQAVVQGWLSSAENNGFAGFSYWQFVGKFPSGYQSPDDGNGISTWEPTFNTIKSFASAFDNEN